MKVQLSVNGQLREIEAPPLRRLLDVLREDLGLTGSKEGCGEGECGACTVLLAGRPVNSCLIPIAQLEGQEVTTVEGLAEGEQLNQLQRALVECGGTQCGICTPGIAVCLSACLQVEPRPTRARVRELLAGNLCRCTGYQLIVDAALQATEGSA